jgi:hypothetical protein
VTQLEKKYLKLWILASLSSENWVLEDSFTAGIPNAAMMTSSNNFDYI